MPIKLCSVANQECKFATQVKDATTCTLYRANARDIGFTVNPSADTIGFGRVCYFRPSSCSFKLQCPATDPNCGGKFVVATPDQSNATSFPTAFVANRAAGTTFTISNNRADMTIDLGRKRYLATVPSASTYKQPSAVSFFAELGTGPSNAAPLTCIQNRDQTFNEPAEVNVYCQSPGDYGSLKSAFFACPDATRGRKTLRLAQDPYYNGRDGCYDTRISFDLVAFVAHR